MTGVYRGSVAWGDYDNDSDLDILLAGSAGPNNPIAKIYQNNSGAFADISAGLSGVSSGSVAWGDHDNDGDLDILLTGGTGYYSQVSKVYQNTGGTFADIGVGLTGVDDASSAWGDYDNDGDLDILLTGWPNLAKIYRNNGAVPNTVPAAPGNLSAAVDDHAATLSWDAASDAQTPAAGLTYNLMVGTTSNGIDINSPMANVSTGWRRVVQLGGTNHNESWTLNNLPDGDYFWRVQAVDAAFAGSPFSAEGMFTIGAPSDWTEVTPPTSPFPRTLHGMAYIGDNKVLLFGGTDGAATIYNDTWIYDITANTWTNMNPATRPGTRCRMGMAYIGNGKVLMYGGSPVSARFGLNPAIETWLYTLATNTWTKLAPTGVPPALDGHSMCFISGSDKVLMFGGRLVKGLFTRSDQTWIFDLSENKWTRKNQTPRPTGRASCGMAWLGGDQALLFGGIVDIQQIDETWLYDRSDNTWTKLSPAVTPPARYGLAAASLGGDQVLIYGGRADILSDNPDSNSTYIIFDDTWVFDVSDNTWVEDGNNATTPGQRQNPRLAETSLDGSGRIVLFGGNTDTELFGDTWTFGGGDYLAKMGLWAEENEAEESQNNQPVIPSAFALAQNYPNPFNPSTTMVFDIAEATDVRLVIYDVLGRVVNTLVNDQREAGQYQATWNSTNDLGEPVSAGLYFCKMTTGEFEQTIKLMLVK